MARSAVSRKQRMPVQYGTKKTPERMQLFLDRLKEGDTIGVASDAADISYVTVYAWRKEDSVFAEMWDAAVEKGIDKFEQEVRRRAFEGVEKPVFQGGLEVGRIREFSDTLAVLTMKGRRKHIYSERTEVTGAGGGPVQHEIEVTFVKASDGKRSE